MPPAASTPMAGYAYAQPQKSGGALKVVLIVIACVVGVGIIGVGVAGYIGYRALHKMGASITAGNAAGVSDADLGVSIYPGAAHINNGAARIKIGSISSATASFTSNDPVSSVVTFYRDKLGADAMVTESGRATVLQARNSDNPTEGTTVTVMPEPLGSGTRITITHVEKGGQ